MNIIRLLSVALIGFSSALSTASAATNIMLPQTIFENETLSFHSHTGAGPFDTALAMSIQYQPVVSVRNILNKTLGKNLDYFKLWDPAGEAHVTVITPVEYFNVLKPYVSIEKMEQIALMNSIQESDIEVLGLGRGQKELNGKKEETYFLIVKSLNLKFIRHKIFHEYLKNGGDPALWSPDNFYPHITVGYTLRDLHESDGVIKDMEHSFDPRFKISIIE